MTVFLGKGTYQALDAVVGDVTITSNRSQYVDFTLPYTELGMGMVMPIETGKTKSMWVFLKPLTVDLWLVSGALFIVTGWVVWVIEHKINDECKGSTAQQVGMIFWYSFSTLVFAQSKFAHLLLFKFLMVLLSGRNLKMPFFFSILLNNFYYTS